MTPVPFLEADRVRRDGDEPAFRQLMGVGLVRIAGQADDLALPQVEAGSVLVVTEHRRGRSGEVVRNADERRDELVRADRVPDFLADIAAAINPLEMFDGRVGLRWRGAEKLMQEHAVNRTISHAMHDARAARPGLLSAGNVPPADVRW